MSGGELFDNTYPNFGLAGGKGEDDKLNELYYDLFIGGEFAVRKSGGLCQSLDFYLSGDICEEGYLRKLERFKVKWFGQTDFLREVYDWAYSGLEGCDGDERELYSSILNAIARYRRANDGD